MQERIKGEKMSKYELIATAAMGLEAIVAKEVQLTWLRVPSRKWKSHL